MIVDWVLGKFSFLAVICFSCFEIPPTMRRFKKEEKEKKMKLHFLIALLVIVGMNCSDFTGTGKTDEGAIGIFSY